MQNVDFCKLFVLSRRGEDRNTTANTESKDYIRILKIILYKIWSKVKSFKPKRSRAKFYPSIFNFQNLVIFIFRTHFLEFDGKSINCLIEHRIEKVEPHFLLQA